MNSPTSGDGIESAWIYRGYEVLGACLVRWQQNGTTPGVPPSDDVLSRIAAETSEQLFQDFQILPESHRLRASKHTIEGMLYMVMKMLDEQDLIGPVSEN
jgi:hypothetical protein